MFKKKKSALSKLNDKIAISNADDAQIYEQKKAEEQKKEEIKAQRKANSPLNRLNKNATDNLKPETPDTELQVHSARPSTDDDMPDIDYDKFEQEVDADDLLNARLERKKEAQEQLLRKILTIVLIVGCVYFVFLIYGVANTKYTYDDAGKVVAQKLDVKDIKAMNEFDNIATEYRQARTVYEDILKLDYRIAAGIEDPLVIAPEYEKELEKIEKLTIQVQAMTVSSQYTQTQAMLLSWIQNDVAIYCQRMSQAISQNNSTYAQQALDFKSLVYNDFSLITENLTTLSENVEGIDASDLKSWSPESYIRDNVGGLEGGK